jgi:hypothetical protein
MLQMIESYSFGRMIIAGSIYTKDVIIFPDGSILSPWWRHQGHVLALNDLDALLATEPEIIICGTGAMGLMRPSVELQDYLAASNTEFIAQRSSEAAITFNKMSGKSSVGGCFHLTC